MCAASAGYPVRKSIQQDVLGTRFPQLCQEDPEMPVAGSPWGRRQPCRKVLPDRSRAARDRANQKLVEYIVKARGAESHLQAILRNTKPSRWLNTFLNSGQYMTCVETYLEDEEQLDLVVKYLQGVYQETGSRMLTQINGDRIRFILDVLLPEVSGPRTSCVCGWWGSVMWPQPEPQPNFAQARAVGDVGQFGAGVSLSQNLPGGLCIVEPSTCLAPPWAVAQSWMF